MFNQIVIVGKIEAMQADYSEDRMNGMLVMAVERQFAEANGEYLTDYFNVQLWRGMIETLKDSYHPGDLIAVNGRLQNDGEAGKWLIIAEKVALIHKAEDTCA